MKEEVSRLRTLLQAHVDEEKKKSWPLDVSDICKGGDEEEEKTQCIREICNTRQAIAMAGATMQRRASSDSRRASYAAREQMRQADMAAAEGGERKSDS